MSNDLIAITNLLYRYAETMDSGDLQGAAALFRHARIKVPGCDTYLDEAGILRIWQQRLIIYPCGTPRTRHIISNPIIDIDDASARATVRSYYTVLQAPPGHPLQPIAAGRYHDEFERIDQQWRFSFRDYSLLDLAGDLGHHLNGR
ncbi:nuclear transport factor 2 family protein [Pseudomonas sp. BJa5]|uniref:nuclear transport factor 2 family protein n=1 Tax=Pseudomonas sp. BJa5 TaxID=2936270 RepID=UPI002559558F|nr:nuclear transport factor 2 family protein [Pseudomonas sp. BGr12]MDL2422875.1 nuclear transport factor 2 family protein [Pseudomonas sp. BGr12]